ncbi:GNAT family N-acetyltransferase [Ideonella livida]|uniref:GNAT family N-acetyltransferase n=1 Tax=Ideonella livida TaxID=2707176 RepID=A0A7C9PEU1_9BURK|nr:GNAT family N-acetyltransferase [Ideonella livida]NDY89909.1 GNAT family N-acetyltransferase [Ideonella livida]
MTAPAFTLRRATPADAEAFAQLFGDEAVQAGTLQLPWPSVEAWRQRLTEPAAAGPQRADLQLVAQAVGPSGLPEVIASAGLHTVSPQVRRRHVLGLGISVRGAWQGRGVGAALMGALCDYADRWAGVLRLELTVYTDNARAIALYQRFGFVQEGVMRAYALRDGRYVDVLAMARLHPDPPRRA